MSGKSGTASGGAGGVGGAHATGGSASEAGASGSKGGSAGAAPDGGPAGGVDPAQAIDSACAGNRAFVANGAAYVYPTPPTLASALGALTYDASSHPITLVLAVAGDGTAVTAASASPDPESGSSRSFPDSMKPDLTPALVKAGGFATTTQQQDAWLAFSDASGEKYLRLGNLAFSATTSAGCTTAMVSLTAVIPASEAGLSLELPSGTTTVGALAGPSNGGAWDLKLLFTAASADFDFGST